MVGVLVDTEGSAWLSLDTVFWLTIALVLFLTIASAMLRRRKRDAALRLLDDSPVTVILSTNEAVTGRLQVTSQGIEILLQRPEDSRAGMQKSSTLIYEPELATVTAIVRAPRNLSAPERARRQADLRTHIEPSVLRDTGRAVRNVVNTARDASAQLVAVVMGRLRPATSWTAALRAQEHGVMGFGHTVMTLSGNAYEPLLERLYGEPVIVHITAPAKNDPPPPPREYGGYLVAYTDKYLCIMANSAEDSRSARLISPAATSAPVEGDGVRIERNGSTASIVATGSHAVVLNVISIADRPAERSSTVLLEGSRHEIKDTGSGALAVSYELTRAVDLVAPRARTQVRFGATTPGRR
jgi:hypothetical protein